MALFGVLNMLTGIVVNTLRRPLPLDASMNFAAQLSEETEPWRLLPRPDISELRGVVARPEAPRNPLHVPRSRCAAQLMHCSHSIAEILDSQGARGCPAKPKTCTPSFSSLPRPCVNVPSTRCASIRDGRDPPTDEIDASVADCLSPEEGATLRSLVARARRVRIQAEQEGGYIALALASWIGQSTRERHLEFDRWRRLKANAIGGASLAYFRYGSDPGRRAIAVVVAGSNRWPGPGVASARSHH